MSAAPPREAPAPAPDAAAAGRRRNRPLYALLVVTFLVGLTWAFVTPAFQSPDENAHFGFVQTLVETGNLPGDAAKLPYSTEQEAAMSVSNSNQTAGSRDTKMEWNRPVWELWLHHDHPDLAKAVRTDSGGLNPASSNPPLYYLYESAGYAAASGGNLFAQLTLMRVLSVLWQLATVAGVWLLVMEVFRGDRLLALAGAGLAALAPMISFVSASVTPDSMLIAVWTFALWLGARILRRGITPASAAVFLAVVGGATVVKATSYALVPAALLVLAIALYRRRPLALKRAAAIVAAGLGALAATSGAWFIAANALSRPAAAQVSSASTTSGLDVRELLSYVWQYYLPRIPGQNDFPTAAHVLPAYDVWFKGVWFQFGWTEVILRNRYYVLLLALTLVVVIAAASQLWRIRARVDKAMLAYFALVTVTLLAGLHWTDYRMIKAGGGFAQGRYLLPLVGLAALVLALALRRLRPAWRPYAVAATLGGLVVLQAVALAVSTMRFYA